MSIYTVNYRKAFLPKPNLTRILGTPTYNTLRQIQLELKSNTIFVHSNLVGSTHKHLGIFITNTKYATLSDVAYVCPVHPGILQIPSNASRAASYELKIMYDDNLRVFHKVRVVEQALIQQVFTAVYKKNII